jgi:hypothetical protein
MMQNGVDLQQRSADLQQLSAPVTRQDDAALPG